MRPGSAAAMSLWPTIEVKLNRVLTKIAGNESPERICYRSLDTEEETEADTGWVFVCSGESRRRSNPLAIGPFSLSDGSGDLTI